MDETVLEIPRQRTNGCEKRPLQAETKCNRVLDEDGLIEITLTRGSGVRAAGVNVHGMSWCVGRVPELRRRMTNAQTSGGQGIKTSTRADPVRNVRNNSSAMYPASRTSHRCTVSRRCLDARLHRILPCIADAGLSSAVNARNHQCPMFTAISRKEVPSARPNSR